MSGFLEAVAAALAVSLVMPLYRVVSGPTHFDRLTGLGLFGTTTVVLIVLIGALYGRVDLFVDIALGYALVGFVGTLALAKYFESVHGGPR